MPMTMATAELRKLLREVLRTDAELDAFCMDYCPKVHQQFGNVQDRLQKENLLLQKVPEDLLHKWLGEEQARSATLLGAASYGAALGAALRLDRTAQWHDIIERSREPGSVAYLLHGQRERAGLTFFIDRVCRFLAPEQGDRHRIFKVPFMADGIGVRTGEEWALRLQSELALRLGRRGEVPLRELLRLATARQPFFILIGRFPLPTLDEAEQAGLEEFVAKLLPKFLRDVPYVRILLAHDYEKPAGSLAKKLEAWMRRGAELGKYQFLPLDEAVLPSWDDVQRYLSKHKQVPEARIAALKPEYDRLRSRKTLSYEDLANFLDRRLDT